MNLKGKWWMIKREYRIAYREGYDEYYPQVRTLFIGIPVTKWLRITKHNGGSFGLYDTLEYPKETRDEAEYVIWEYNKWKTNRQMVYIPYRVW